MNNILVQQNNQIANVNIEDKFTNMLTNETKRAYVQAIKEFFGKELNEISIQEMQSVDPDMVNQYAIRLEENGLSHATINRKLAALHTFYKFLCRRNIGIMTYNPFDTSEGAIRFKNAQKAYSDKRALDSDEMNQLLDAAKQESSIEGVRDLLILELLATTGMRRAEICDIKIGDIQQTLGKYVIEITGKGNKNRIIVLSNEIVKIVNQYMELRGITLADKDEWLIVSHANRKSKSGKVSTNMIYRVVKEYADKAGIDPSTLSPHSIRHSYATQCLDMGMPIQDVKDLMGHSSISTTQRYNHSFNIIKNNPAEQLSKLYNK